MKGRLHYVEIDLGLAPHDDRPYYLRLGIVQTVVGLERLLKAHAGFDEYLKERD